MKKIFLAVSLLAATFAFVACGGDKEKEEQKGAESAPDIAAVPELVKYWAQRYRLFSRFDDGIKLDRGNVDVYFLT